MRNTASAAWMLGLAWPAITGAQASVPPVTVADLIGLTHFGNTPGRSWGPDTHALSVDGERVALLLQRGILAKNTVDYTLVVLRTADTRGTARPDTVAMFTSASNEPAISHVRWLADNRTLAFLGGRPGQPAQVYTVDISTHTLTPRTHSATAVTSFEIAPAGEPLIYQQQSTVDTSRYAAKRARGFVLSPKAWLSDAIAGDWLDDGSKWQALVSKGYRIARGGTETPLSLPDSAVGYKDCRLGPEYGPPFSPRGDAVMLICAPRAPASLSGYRNARFRFFAEKFRHYGQVLVLLDLATAQARLISNTVLLGQGESPFVWAPDGSSVLVSNALLPLTGPDSARRTTQRMTAEIDLHTGGITVVADRDSLVVQRWDVRTGLVDFAKAFAWFSVTNVTPRVYYRKTARGWKEVSRAAASAIGPTFVIVQSPNTPPRVAVVGPNTDARREVFDPNPGLLAAHRFGHVEIFHWTTKGGNTLAGGLYYPPGYMPGLRYPLVIQTHGYDSTLFASDGAFTTNYAAQPLAAAGILVLQAAEIVSGDYSSADESPAEAPREQEMLEAAIDALDGRGLIDRVKIGLQGFSRTCFYDLYFLTHSSYAVAAADLADGVDYGYLQYLAFFDRFGEPFERVNGGRPWGPTQAQWLERTSGFRLDQVKAPLRLTAIGPGGLLEEWEPYAGLLLQGKPAELVYIPAGSHVLVKPWERLTSQQGAVDWFRFWLQGYEDPDSTKTPQYTRWRKLHAQRDSTPVSPSR